MRRACSIANTIRISFQWRAVRRCALKRRRGSSRLGAAHCCRNLGQVSSSSSCPLYRSVEARRPTINANGLGEMEGREGGSKLGAPKGQIVSSRSRKLGFASMNRSAVNLETEMSVCASRNEAARVFVSGTQTSVPCRKTTERAPRRTSETIAGIR